MTENTMAATGTDGAIPLRRASPAKLARVGLPAPVPGQVAYLLDDEAGQSRTAPPEAPAAIDNVATIIGPWLAVQNGRKFQIKNPYCVDDDGVWIEKRKLDPTTDQWVVTARERIATAPVLPVRVLFAPDGVELVEIIWWHAKKASVVSEIVTRAAASKGRDLIKALRPLGFPAVDSDGPKIEKYLAVVEADNNPLIGTSRIARQLGWQPDGVFVAGPDRPRRVEPAYQQEQRGALAAHTTAGTLDGWRATAAHAAPYPIVRATVAASFSAPLLGIVEGVPSFLFDLYSTSSGGKTTSAALGYSAWGKPTIERGGIAVWSGTQTAIQLRIALCNGLPVVLDESKNVRTEEIVKRVIYDLPGGEAGARAGEYYSAPITWEVVVISTGERSVLSFTADAGAAARVVSVNGAPFGRDGEQSAAAANAVSDGIAHNYGHAGAAFVELLTAEWREWIRTRHAQLVVTHRTGTDIARRRAPMVALLQVAEEAACHLGVLPYQAMATEQWVELTQGEGTNTDPAERALEVVRSLVARFGERLYEPKLNQLQPSAGWIGRRGVHDGRALIGLIREPLKKELADQGYELDAVEPHWREKGWLTLESETDSRLVRRRIRGSQPRLFEFPAELIDGPDVSED